MKIGLVASNHPLEAARESRDQHIGIGRLLHFPGPSAGDESVPRANGFSPCPPPAMVHGWKFRDSLAISSPRKSRRRNAGGHLNQRNRTDQQAVRRIAAPDTRQRPPPTPGGRRCGYPASTEVSSTQAISTFFAFAPILSTRHRNCAPGSSGNPDGRKPIAARKFLPAGAVFSSKNTITATSPSTALSTG